MKIVIFTVCRNATNRDGILSIDGAFTNLLTATIPARLRGSLATRLFFTAEEEGLFSGTLKLIDPDGVSVLQAPIQLEIPFPELDGTSVYLDSVGEIDLTLRKWGEYQFHIGKDGEAPDVYPLYVSQKK